jgi:hypothetical protein
MYMYRVLLGGNRCWVAGDNISPRVVTGRRDRARGKCVYARPWWGAVGLGSSWTVYYPRKPHVIYLVSFDLCCLSVVSLSSIGRFKGHKEGDPHRAVVWGCEGWSLHSASGGRKCGRQSGLSSRTRGHCLFCYD